jgi:hypothetical protein
MMYFIADNGGKRGRVYAVGIGGLSMAWVENPLYAQKFTAEEVEERVRFYTSKKRTKGAPLVPLPAMFPVVGV